LDQLSLVNFRGKQHDVYSRAQKGTGTWIFEEPTFKSWLAGRHKVLWCWGVPGAGKTVLASIIIDHLVKMFETSNVGLAWMFIDYREHDLQTMETLFADLLRQLAEKRGKVSDSIFKSFGLGLKEGKPNMSKYKKLLQEELPQFTKTFVIINALDELRNKNLRKMLISEFRRLISTNSR
jgi:Cdc6-like AAA superfamily ATPase